MNQIFGQSFIIFAKLRYMGQILLKLRAVELLLPFIQYRLGQLNNKRTKIAVNWAIQHFEDCSQKKKGLLNV